MDNSKRVENILNVSISDVNYRITLPMLTDQELLYCIANEKRKSSLTKLKSLARKRSLEVKED